MIIIIGITITIYISHYITPYYNPTSSHNITTISQGPTVPSSSVELSFSKSWRTPSKRTDSWRATFRDAGVAVEDHWLRRVLKWGNHGKMMMKYIKVGKIGTYFLEQTSGKMLMIFDYPRANVQKETRKNYHAFPFSNSTSSQNSTSSAGMIFPIAPGNGFS